jgi:hypothetical protein
MSNLKNSGRRLPFKNSRNIAAEDFAFFAGTFDLAQAF